METKSTIELSVTVKASVFQNRDRMITIKIKGTKNPFSIAEQLSQLGKYQAIEAYFERLVRAGAEDYALKAEKAILSIEPLKL